MHSWGENSNISAPNIVGSYLRNRKIHNFFTISGPVILWTFPIQFLFVIVQYMYYKLVFVFRSAFIEKAAPRYYTLFIRFFPLVVVHITKYIQNSAQ